MDLFSLCLPYVRLTSRAIEASGMGWYNGMLARLGSMKGCLREVLEVHDAD